MSVTRKRQRCAVSSSSQEPSQNSVVPALAGLESWTHSPPEVNNAPQAYTPHPGGPAATLSVPDGNRVNAGGQDILRIPQLCSVEADEERRRKITETEQEIRRLKYNIQIHKAQAAQDESTLVLQETILSLHKEVKKEHENGEMYARRAATYEAEFERNGYPKPDVAWGRKCSFEGMSQGFAKSNTSRPTGTKDN